MPNLLCFITLFPEKKVSLDCLAVAMSKETVTRFG